MRHEHLTGKQAQKQPGDGRRDQADWENGSLSGELSTEGAASEAARRAVRSFFEVVVRVAAEAAGRSLEEAARHLESEGKKV